MGRHLLCVDEHQLVVGVRKAWRFIWAQTHLPDWIVGQYRCVRRMCDRSILWMVIRCPCRPGHRHGIGDELLDCACHRIVPRKPPRPCVGCLYADIWAWCRHWTVTGWIHGASLGLAIRILVPRALGHSFCLVAVHHSHTRKNPLQSLILRVRFYCRLDLPVYCCQSIICNAPTVPCSSPLD